MSVTYEIEDHEFHGDTGVITGTAVFAASTEMDFSADVGGRDGLIAISAELVAVKIDGLSLTRDQIVLVVTNERVRELEEYACERVQEGIDAGDYAEAA